MILMGFRNHPRLGLAPTLGHFMPSGAGRANAAAENGHGIVGYKKSKIWHPMEYVMYVSFSSKHMVRTLGGGIFPPHWKNSGLCGANLHPCVAYPSSRSNSELYKLLQGQGPVIFDAHDWFSLVLHWAMWPMENNSSSPALQTSTAVLLRGLMTKPPIASVPCWLNNAEHLSLRST